MRRRNFTKKEFEDYLQSVREHTNHDITYTKTIDGIEIVIICNDCCMRWFDIHTYKEAYFILSGFEAGVREVTYEK